VVLVVAPARLCARWSGGWSVRYALCSVLARADSADAERRRDTLRSLMPKKFRASASTLLPSMGFVEAPSAVADKNEAISDRCWRAIQNKTANSYIIEITI
jgi:hypothetical protein